MRILGVSLAVAGVLTGTVLGRPPVGETPQANGYFILAGDFHVHAAVGDGAIAPWELKREARRRGLDVITITNHNQRLAGRLGALGQAAPRLSSNSREAIVLVGQEVTTPGFHMIGVGLRETIDWRLSASDAIRAIHAQGGVAIAAHPTLRSWRGDAGAMTLLDGTEVAHPAALVSPSDGRQILAFYRRAAELNPSLASIGSSDFHFGDTLGICRTFLFVREISGAGVLEAVREGRTVAHDRTGRLLGDPSLVSIVKGLIASNPPRTRSDIPSRVAAWVTLLGVALLLVLA
jgi:predicted metal-dependent phosphoesterase TrpH